MNSPAVQPFSDAPPTLEVHAVATQCLALLAPWSEEGTGGVDLRVMPEAAVRRQGHPRHFGMLLLNALHAVLNATATSLQLTIDVVAGEPEWLSVCIAPRAPVAGWVGPQVPLTEGQGGGGACLACRPLPPGLSAGGATGFMVRLPACPPMQTDGVHLHVLLVEDNLVNAETTRDMLCTDAQVRVQVVHTGAQALAALARQPFDVVLMDMFLPDTDGVVLTRRIRRTLPDQAPAIVALTANAFPSDRELCTAAGMVDFLVKPVSMSRLRETVRRWAPTRSTGPA